MYLNDYINGKVYLVVTNPQHKAIGDRTAARLSSLFKCEFPNITAEVGGEIARVFPLTHPQAGFLQKHVPYQTVRFNA